MAVGHVVGRLRRLALEPEPEPEPLAHERVGSEGSDGGDEVVATQLLAELPASTTPMAPDSTSTTAESSAAGSRRRPA